MKKGKLTPMEQEFKRLVNSKNAEDIVISKIFFYFWKLYDKLHRTNHSECTQNLYVSPELKISKIAHIVYVEDRTLYGYRDMYMQLYKILIKEKTDGT